jgi:drug/metabolite transporter (DMT)-like permease
MSLKSASPLLPSLATDWHFWIGGLLYGGGFVLWMFLLKLNNLSTIFASAAGSLVVVTALMGYFVLGEALSIKMMIGLVLIVSGICCVTQ